jgi:hypothetical protein
MANPPDFLIHLVERIPALDCTMQPQNFYSAVPAMAALFAAIGLNDFLKNRRGGPMPGWAVIASSALFAQWCFREFLIWHLNGRFATGTRSITQTAIALALFSLCLWCLRQTAGRMRTFAAAVLLLATGVDYQVHGSGRWFNAVDGDVDDEFPGYGMRGIDDEGYRAMWQNRHYRVTTDHHQGPDPVQYRIWGLATEEGFDPFLTMQYKQLILHWVPFANNRTFYADVHNEAMLQTFGVRYVLLRNGAEDDAALAANPNFKRIGRKAVYCHVYEYLHAKPPYHWEDERGGSVQLIAWMPERREFAVRSDRGGRFVLIEQFFSGWRAFVDGQPSAIERWGSAFQSIRLTAGEHRVRFEFHALSAVTVAINAIAVVALLALAWVDAQARRRSRV